MKAILMMSMVVCSTTALAVSRGPWSLTIGPAWRARVESSISGTATVPGIETTATRTTADGAIVVVQDPDYPDEPTLTKYAATKIIDETVVSANPTAARFSEDEIGRPMGVKGCLGFDCYSSEQFSAGFNLKIAGYWNLHASASGYAGGGTAISRSTTEYYLYNDGPYPDDADFTGFLPSTTPYNPYTTSSDDSIVNYPGHTIQAKIRSDLYQVGFGPRVTWHLLDCMDVYGGVDALLNIAHIDLKVGPSNTDEVECMFGLGGNLGAILYLSDGMGLYADVGYEWVDTAETDINQARVKVDYSSLVVSAGILVRF